MICSNCSNTIDSKTKFCPYCDAPVDVAASRSDLDRVTAPSVATGSNPVVNRYIDLYRTAYVMTGLGTTVKTVGIVVAAVIFFFWFIVGVATASETSSSPFTAQSSAGAASFFVSIIIGGIFGALVGGLFFLLGVLISAQGQLLMAHADSAVHTSPFLSDKERATAMSLPYTGLATAEAAASGNAKTKMTLAAQPTNPARSGEALAVVAEQSSAPVPRPEPLVPADAIPCPFCSKQLVRGSGQTHCHRCSKELPRDVRLALK